MHTDTNSSTLQARITKSDTSNTQTGANFVHGRTVASTLDWAQYKFYFRATSAVTYL